MNKYYDLTVTLLGIEPPIFRRFLLSTSASFLDLHDAIQHSFGWENDHPFDFKTDTRRKAKEIAGVAASMVPFGALRFSKTPDSSRVRLSSYFTGKTDETCFYTYDFGDNWQHQVLLNGTNESPEKFFRQLLDGARSCPPEDCGGTYGYERCVAAAAMSDAELEDDPDAAEQMDWLGDWNPEAFHLAEIKRRFDR